MLLHSFCNAMGFPDFVTWWRDSEHPLYDRRRSILAAYLVGVSAFVVLWRPTFDAASCRGMQCLLSANEYS